MKKTKNLILYTLLAISTLSSVKAQLPNSNFENWTIDAGGKDSLIGWSSSNSVVMGIVVSLYKEDITPFQGNFSAHLSTAPFGFIGYSTVGMMVNGNAIFSYGGGSTAGNNGVKLQSGGGTPITYKPNELKGYYKAPTNTVGNLPLAKILLSKYNTVTNKRDTISYTEYNFSTSSTYSSFSIPLVDLMPGVTPDSVTTIFYSANPSTVGAVGIFADFYLDSLELPMLETFGTDVQTACSPYTWIDGNSYTSSNNTATDTLINTAGYDSIVTLDLTIISVNSNITQAGVLLTADEIGATYQWLDCPAMTPISGANTQSYTATINGEYAVIVTKNGCSATSNCSSVLTVGITDNDFGKKIILFPNPTDGKFLIDLGDLTGNNSYTIKTTEGRIVKRGKTTKSKISIDLETESRGIYFLTVINDKKISTHKIIKR